VPNRFGDTPQDYRRAIAEVVVYRMQDDTQLQLLDGLEAIGTSEGLTVDRLHPDPHGMVLIADKIASTLGRMT
jgi:hypothetical protein